MATLQKIRGKAGLLVGVDRGGFTGFYRGRPFKFRSYFL